MSSSVTDITFVLCTTLDTRNNIVMIKIYCGQQVLSIFKINQSAKIKFQIEMHKAREINELTN